LDGCKLFVSSLSYSTTAEVLKRLFESVGKVADCHVAKDRESGESRGFAFVTMAREADALLALEEFNGHELDGREMKVNVANAGGSGGGRRKDEPVAGHGAGEEVNVTAYKVRRRPLMFSCVWSLVFVYMFAGASFHSTPRVVAHDACTPPPPPPCAFFILRCAVCFLVHRRRRSTRRRSGWC
jgi:RNA recognition motif-containing protein